MDQKRREKKELNEGQEEYKKKKRMKGKERTKEKMKSWIHQRRRRRKRKKRRRGYTPQTKWCIGITHWGLRCEGNNICNMLKIINCGKIFWYSYKFNKCMAEQKSSIFYFVYCVHMYTGLLLAFEFSVCIPILAKSCNWH